MNKECLNWNFFEGLNDGNIITLVTQTKNKNSEKDDEECRTILSGVETKMSQKILTIMYGAIRKDDERTVGYYMFFSGQVNRIYYKKTKR